ncbi:hypothetical protein LEP1GSC151_4693 [Leptospira interrogans serovar Grippotyphosa str. LT2186]|uniref:Uncharacterized protein n=1 Tax=Leptospira interrogans serovar Grippotyphosa str. LT2186 TaxID=1001599 RepID=M3FZM6_LEPIR|nr:hypothetical protein LEP1GSC151_4693 [Leptospira interrogans serovar Grippotyphosa str. LT2186]
MDRRSGLKKAHFSSVPTRMSLFTCKKVCFSDREKFSEPPPRPKIGKTQHNAFLWVALENSAQRFPMGRVGKLSTTLSYGSRWKTQHNALYESRWKTQHNALYESRCGVGYGSLNDPCSMSFFTGYEYIITFISSA